MRYSMNNSFLDKIIRLLYLLKKYLYLILAIFIIIFFILINIPLTIEGQMLNSYVNNLPIVGNALSVTVLATLWKILKIPSNHIPIHESE